MQAHAMNDELASCMHDEVHNAQTSRCALWLGQVEMDVAEAANNEQRGMMADGAPT